MTLISFTLFRLGANISSTCPRSLRTGSEVMTKSAWARTGSIAVRSRSTARDRLPASPMRGWLRRVSLYRLMMEASSASTNNTLYWNCMAFRESIASNKPSKFSPPRMSHTMATCS